MSISCTRCDSTGFLNIDQVDEETRAMFDSTGNVDIILEWIKSHTDHDVQVCDCCGDGEGWYGEPGRHYTSQDPSGNYGYYAYNGGLCECN